ncbi:hypothetical protein PhCBS80983_g03497 [Powellomyces hirtus]|uniref:Proteasome assembly chaperone 1 n=1 Tax=Powellomyces hirtus TaxID=109895 RepID=A0A507E265_9FUNG|nr:hypothetical protein PhCBS80983_g03497 [Powellomyces hirtus]
MDIWPFQPDLTARDYEAEEMEELEAVEAGIAPVVRPVLEWAPGCDTQEAKTPQLLLLGLPGAGALFLNGRFQKRKFVGSMRFPSAEVKGSAWEKQMLADQTFTLYELLDEPSTLIVICQYDISSELSPAWADVFFTHIKPQRTMILDSMTEYQFKQASEETAPPLLRKLKTTLAHEIDAVEHLAPPSIITGPAAAFLTWLEVRHLPAYLYVSLLETQFGRHDISVATLQAFETILSTLPASVREVATTQTKAEYIKAINAVAKKDVSHLYL